MLGMMNWTYQWYRPTASWTPRRSAASSPTSRWPGWPATTPSTRPNTAASWARSRRTSPWATTASRSSRTREARRREVSGPAGAPPWLDAFDAVDARARVPDGALVALGGIGTSRKPMALIRALVEAGVRDLRVVSALGSVDVDYLIAAGCVAEVHTAGVAIDGVGMAPRYRSARQSGTVRVVEWSEGSLHAALDAAARGLPSLRLRDLAGLRRRRRERLALPSPPTRSPAAGRARTRPGARRRAAARRRGVGGGRSVHRR